MAGAAVDRELNLPVWALLVGSLRDRPVPHFDERFTFEAVTPHQWRAYRRWALWRNLRRSTLRNLEHHLY
jgi:hypothetical protein